MALRPRLLPKARSRTISRTLASSGKPNPYTRPEDVDTVGLMARHLRAADLYWSSEDMTALAFHAGGQLTQARWATADRPSPCGLIVCDGGLGMVNTGAGLYAPVDALAWGPGPHDTMVLWHFVARERLFDMARIPRPEAAPPLVGVFQARLPVTVEEIALDGLPAHDGLLPARPIVAFLAAAWHLMRQPQLVDRTVTEPSRADARSLRRADMPADPVTLMTLRRMHTPQDRDPDAGTDHRTYRHRWVVSGHWRNQPHGPDRALRRQTWVPAHMKGPEGAPLLMTEKVNVWRR